MSLFRGLSRVNIARATRSFHTPPADEGIIRGLNKVLLIGRVSSDPIQSVGKNGAPRVMYDVVTYNPKRYPSFHNIVCWQPAQIPAIMEKFKRGLLVYVEGKLISRQVVDERSERKVITHVVQDGFQILAPEKPLEERPTTNTEIPATESTTESSEEAEPARYQ
ncbi:10958_t:CDS:2 [Paraglomus occultum]|uniref:10958_t:CDS:1 n=1 Tax=Paraglomus occultum TaxID=144539 RepID=A0A9N9G1U9_9GLOM|nr:10958_t:CDS:2 [Paraglomus occultum]